MIDHMTTITKTIINENNYYHNEYDIMVMVMVMIMITLFLITLFVFSQ